MSEGQSNDGRPAPAFHAGLVLDGRYRLERPLGEGGMGAVWVAYQLALQREVAVKVLHFSAESSRARLRDEALALAAVRHPAVVQVYDYGEMEGGVPYVVMELVAGEPLGAHLGRVGTLPADEAVALVLPILEGLAAAHRAGIIHRDIKPENVILAPGPTGVGPKLLDFGISRRGHAGASRLTADGSILGTPAYMAPEQVRGVEVDERADVWAVGVLLYELLAGTTPFAADNVFVVIRGVLDKTPSYPRGARGLDGRLWAILMAALRKDPADRTASAPAMRDALAGWLEARKAGPAPRAAAPAVLPVEVSARLAPTLAAGPGSETSLVSAEDAPSSIDALIRAKLGAG